MPSPPIQVFLTTIASQPALRQRQEYLLRILQVKKIPFTSYDLASDESAKRLWKRKAPLDKQQLPGILVGGRFPGTFTDFEEAVEFDELDKFLRLTESWNADVDDVSSLPVKPIGVPGAAMPLQMTPDHLKSKILARSPSNPSKEKPVPVNKRTDEFDVGDELSGYGLQGVKVTEQDLIDLVAELGLDGDEAGDLVKGLAGSSSGTKSEPKSESDRTEKPAEVKQPEEKESGKDTQEIEAVAKNPVKASTEAVEGKSDVATIKESSD
ncbi:hypothetical protein K435DRAFT_646054 [Dendrothele bispora CBS 962.96]|uniref:Uncharacterized protein n=1 Tax=Dendrothele bispora (strain CBS 962.96) TaxID=1314807 RepID=A0A4S8MS90_DENBC|nr:hypothetical protein K435DRAFT_646054 [Dendrothele bispora CBS 962.96]